MTRSGRSARFCGSCSGTFEQEQFAGSLDDVLADEAVRFPEQGSERVTSTTL